MSNEFQSNIEYDIYKKIIEQDMFIFRKIYLDIRLIKDLIIGYILNNVEFNKNSYNKFLNYINSKEYKNRITDIPYINFKEFNINISLDNIWYYYNNINILDNKLIPNTTLSKYIFNIINNLKKKVYLIDNNLVNFKVTLNIYPFKTKTEDSYYLEELFLYIFGIKTNIINNSVENIPDVIIDNDLIMLYDIEELLKTKYLEQYDTEDKIDNLFNKAILSLKITNEENIVKEKSKEEIIKDFDFCEKYLNSLFFFQYIFPNIPL